MNPTTKLRAHRVTRPFFVGIGQCCAPTVTSRLSRARAGDAGYDRSALT